MTAKLLIWTRSRADWEDDRALFAGHDVDVVHVPCINIVPLDIISSFANPPTALVFTSRHGVAAMVGKPTAASILKDLPAYTFGQRTYAAMLAAGFTQARRLNAPNAAAMMPLLLKDLPAHSALLWPTGEEIAFDVAGALNDAGINCQRIVVYRTSAAVTAADGSQLTSEIKQRIATAGDGAIAFASPSTVHAFVEHFRDDMTTIGVRLTARCLGSSTAEAAKSHFRHVWTAPTPELGRLVP